MTLSNRRIATILVHQGQVVIRPPELQTVPIYQASTYHHPGGKGRNLTMRAAARSQSQAGGGGYRPA